MPLFAINPDTGQWYNPDHSPLVRWTDQLTPEQGVRIAASVLPGITPEVIRALLTAAQAPTPPDPGDAEERVTDFLDKHKRFAAAGAEFVAYEGMGASYRILTYADLRDVLAELIAWRALAADRDKVIEALRSELVAEQDRIEVLNEYVETYVDPAPQGDPITASDD